MIEATSGRTFLKSHFLQIANVAPHFYHVEYRRVAFDSRESRLSITTDAYSSNTCESLLRIALLLHYITSINLLDPIPLSC